MAYCSHCGKTLNTRGNYCTHCGIAIHDKGKVGPGEQVKPTPSPENPLGAPEATQSEIRVAPAPKRQWGVIVKAAIKSLLKSLLLSAAILGPGVFLLQYGGRFLGMLWLFGGSFGMMAWTYRKPWRLMVITCLLPPIAALLSYLVQLTVLGVVMPPLTILTTAAGAGLIVGYLRARTHEVFTQDGGVFAQRTTQYLLVWIIAFGGTQILSETSRSVFLIAGGLLTGAFSTAMLMVVSVVLLRKRSSLVKS